MSYAESATPAYQAQAVQLPANHLFDTVLPVRPAAVDRGSVERARPGMVEDLLARRGNARTGFGWPAGPDPGQPAVPAGGA